MALSIRGQALSLLLAFGAGAGLGLFYDLLRPIRRRHGDTLWDLLFCFAAAALAFGLAMRAETGVLGTGELLLSLAGLLAYFWLLSPRVLPLLDGAVQKIRVFGANTQVFAKKVADFAKKLFQKSRG